MNLGEGCLPVVTYFFYRRLVLRLSVLIDPPEEPFAMSTEIARTVL